MRAADLLSRIAAAVFGLALAMSGAYMLFTGHFTLPVRNSARLFYFEGLTLVFLAGSPFVAGMTSVAIALGLVHRESRFVHLAIALSMCLLGLAFMLAPKH